MVSGKSLREMPVPKILNFINDIKRSGILTVKHGDQWVKVYFKKGDIVDLDSSHMPELSLSDFIKRRKLIDEKKLAEYVNDAKSLGMRLGEYLVDRKLISPHDLYEVLHLHIVSKLFKISSWLDGEFSFEEQELPYSPYHVLDVNVGAVIYQGVKEYLDMPKLPIEFRGRKEHKVYRRESSRFRLDDLPLKPKELRMYQLIDGTRTMRQLVLMSKMPRKKAYMALYALYLLGFITFQEPRPSEIKAAERVGEVEKVPEKEAGYEIKVSQRLLDEALKAVIRAETEAERSRRLRREREELEPEELLVVEALEEGEEEEVVEEEVAEEPKIQEPVVYPKPEPMVSEKRAAEPEVEMPAEPKRPAAMEGLSAEDAAMALGPAEALARGRTFLEREHYYEALPFLRRAAQEKPDDPEIYPYLGWATYQTSQKTLADFKEAEGIIKSAIKKDPNSYLPYLYLGKLYNAVGDSDFAKLYYGRALELNPGCREARDELKRIYTGG